MWHTKFPSAHQKQSRSFPHTAGRGRKLRQLYDTPQQSPLSHTEGKVTRSRYYAIDAEATDQTSRPTVARR